MTFDPNHYNNMHSPAPWEISRRLRGDGTRSWECIIAADGTTVCEGLYWNPNSDHDGPLLEAAPDLLEALEKAVARQGFTNVELIAARAAIAKAKNLPAEWQDGN